MRKAEQPDPVLRARAAVTMLNGQQENKDAELAAFMSIFHGRTMTAAEAAAMRR